MPASTSCASTSAPTSRAQVPDLGTFYEIVPVRFVIGAADTHVHLALLVSPWSYTTYRGS